MVSPAPKLRPATLGAVALGGMLGATARVFLPWPQLFQDHLVLSDALPTALINLLGAVLLGTVAGYTTLRPWPEAVHKGVTTGFLGSFTTMSTLAVIVLCFSTGTTLLETSGLSSVVLSIALVTAGLIVFLWFTTISTTGAYRFGAHLAERKP